MDTVPRWIVIAVIIVAMDGCNWAAHLANHRVRMLWRFHELHHSQEDMNVLTVFRTHPLIHVSYLMALIPGIVLLANGALSITVLVLYGGIVAFAHSNTRLGFGPARADLRQSELSPDPPQIGRAPGRQPGLRADHLGSAVPHRRVPHRRYREDRYGAAGRPLLVEQATPAVPSHGPRRSTRRAVSPVTRSTIDVAPPPADFLPCPALDRPRVDDGMGRRSGPEDTLQPCGVD